MAYSWQEVMQGIDIRNEAQREQREMLDITDEQVAEAEAQAGWGLVGTVVCGALWGPLGAYICKQAAVYGVDALNDWEDIELSEGKFYKSEEEEYRRTKDIAEKEQNIAQITGSLTGLVNMYLSSGGMEGDWDPTTFGGGESEWSLFGKGSPTTALDPDTIISENYSIADKFYELGSPPPDWATAGGPSADYIPGLIKGKPGEIGQKVAGAPGVVAGSIADLLERNQ